MTTHAQRHANTRSTHVTRFGNVIPKRQDPIPADTRFSTVQIFFWACRQAGVNINDLSDEQWWELTQIADQTADKLNDLFGDTHA